MSVVQHHLHDRPDHTHQNTQWTRHDSVSKPSASCCAFCPADSEYQSELTQWSLHHQPLAVMWNDWLIDGTDHKNTIK